MNKSESIKEIAIAMNKAQSEMSGAKKSSKNPFFKSNYANLEEVIECVKTPFADNGLSFMQFPKAVDGFAGVELIIMHVSGEWISQELMLKCAKNDPQGMGSAITYARRYTLQSAAGLPSEDDDGNAASKPPAKPQYKQPAPVQAAPAVITPAQVKRLMTIANGVPVDQVKAVLKHHGFTSSKDITTFTYTQICLDVEALKK